MSCPNYVHREPMQLVAALAFGRGSARLATPRCVPPREPGAAV
jgi:hypothetical protein